MPRVEIVIDPRPAGSGSKTAERALDGVSSAARRTRGNVQKFDSNLEQLQRQMSAVGSATRLLAAAGSGSVEKPG